MSLKYVELKQNKRISENWVLKTINRFANKQNLFLVDSIHKFENDSLLKKGTCVEVPRLKIIILRTFICRMNRSLMEINSNEIQKELNKWI